MIGKGRTLPVHGGREQQVTGLREELDGLDALGVSGELLDALLGDEALVLAVVGLQGGRRQHPRPTLVVQHAGSVKHRLRLRCDGSSCGTAKLNIIIDNN